MKILFKDANVLNANGESQQKINILVDNGYIAEIDEDILKIKSDADRIINAENLLLIPGLYNTHTHLPMTIFKGYAEDMTLDKWLFERIFPAEDKLNEEIVYYATLLGIAEQIKNGVISCSDMYYFTETVLRAADESGIKINACRPAQSFDENENPKDNYRFAESKMLYKNYHNSANGRIKIDMSIHAEYTANEKIVAAVADYSNENKIINHVHISETKKEHDECIQRYNKTPCEFFNSLAFFDSPTLAAHCVHVTQSDMDILSQKGVTVAHNPSSNLKLACGVANVTAMIEKGINVTLGTDGSASNNNLDILKEMYLASILQKGITGDPTVLPAKDMLKFATANSAKVQGRADCGSIEVGKKADITALDLGSLEASPIYDYSSSLLYSMSGRNVVLTMCDGKILYENGEYKTLDIEKIKYKIKKLAADYYS